VVEGKNSPARYPADDPFEALASAFRDAPLVIKLGGVAGGL
jgi:hypothetical protein